MARRSTRAPDIKLKRFRADDGLMKFM